MLKISAAALFFLLAAGCQKNPQNYISSCASPYIHEITVGQAKLCVQSVSSQSDEAKGLGMRDSMGQAQGMLFDFSGKNSMPAFWMKDMKFDLDLIWIKDGRVVGITKSVVAPKNAQENQESKLKDYYPPSAIDEVLEVNSGWSDRNNIKIGDEINIAK